MMAITYRRPREDELVPFVRLFVDVMNQKMSDEDIERGRDTTEFDRSWVADDDGRIVGTTTGHSYEMTVPGGALAPMAGLTLVATAPTHRRQGIMTNLVGRFFDDARARGDVFAGLFASDASIYGRFGFGTATRFASVSLDRYRATGIETFSAPGRVRWLRLKDALPELPAIYERTRPTRAGEIFRPDHAWDGYRRRADTPRDGKPLWAAVHDGADGPDGYAVYRVESKWIDHTAQNEVQIVELAAVGPVRVALWQFLLSLDLVRTVTDGNARLEEPVQHVLADPRQLRCTGVYDQLQLRVIDVERALGARQYGADGALTVGVADAGTFLLKVADGAAVCEPVSTAPDLTISQQALGTVYLGDRSWTDVAEAGLLDVHDARALRRADAMFAVSPTPQCLSIF